MYLMTDSRACVCNRMVWCGSPRHCKVGAVVRAHASMEGRESNNSLPRSSRLAVGSFLEEHTNRIQVLGVHYDEKKYV